MATSFRRSSRFCRLGSRDAALLDDLADSGRMDDTLVMMLGEFGRTPKINGSADSRHPRPRSLGPLFLGLFAGAEFAAAR